MPFGIMLACCLSCSYNLPTGFPDGRPQASAVTAAAHPRAPMSLVNVACARILTAGNPQPQTLACFERSLISAAGRAPDHPLNHRLLRGFPFSDQHKIDLIESLKTSTGESLMHTSRWANPWPQ